MKFLEGQKDVVIVTKSGGNMDIETSSMSVNEMLRYRETILKNLEEAKTDLEVLRLEDVNMCRIMDEHSKQLDATLKERANLAH